MKQYEAVINTIESLGGIATLGQINQEIFKVKECEWKTKTPYASIRRIVQLDKNIYKIKPGLYALVKYKGKFEKQGIIAEETNSNLPEKFVEFNHSYYQGLLLEIGNMKGMSTYVPAQDKNKLFLTKTLGEISSLDKMLAFSYDELVNRAKTIDVIWFNERKLLSSVFEVEHSTDIQNSLLKFNDLQDFYSQFYIVGSKLRNEEFIKKINYSSFKEIKNRIKFIDYQFVSDLHTKMYELNTIGNL
ncbi:hypothetical protein ACFOWM_12690 [Ferruginibacter yonginensis]|uniref:Transcriptional regulator, AbiEi antitoxin, Type IV TA system n=1 Tax=Ferruginibacter yonginensis TaxID=1310416 RepID=A0ABV8QU40_9BACT